MNVEIARMDRAVAFDTTSDALDRLSQWVAAAQQAHALVAQLINTAFVPDVYKPKVDPRATPAQRAAAEETAIATGTAAVLHGISLGLDPLTALQQIYVVHNRPGLYAKLMLALVQSRGHEVWQEDLSDSRCVMAGRRWGSEVTERVTVTMDMARRAGWTRNEAYTKTPQDMLWSRAVARICDRIASDVIKGIASVEQIQDEVHATAEVGNGHRTVRRNTKGRPTLAIDPPLDSEQAPAAAGQAESALLAGSQPSAIHETPAAAEGGRTVPQPPAITPAQQRKLHALLREHDKADRDVALVWIAGVLGREVESTKDLSQDEAGAVIDALDALTDELVQPSLDPDAWPETAPIGGGQ